MHIPLRYLRRGRIQQNYNPRVRVATLSLTSPCREYLVPRSRLVAGNSSQAKTPWATQTFNCISRVRDLTVLLLKSLCTYHSISFAMPAQPGPSSAPIRAVAQYPGDRPGAPPAQGGGQLGPAPDCGFARNQRGRTAQVSVAVPGRRTRRGATPHRPRCGVAHGAACSHPRASLQAESRSQSPAPARWPAAVAGAPPPAGVLAAVRKNLFCSC